MANPFVKGDPRINRNGRPKKGHTLTEFAKTFFEGFTTRDPNTGRIIKQTERKKQFIEAVYDKAVRGDMSAAKLLWNYLDGLPPFTGRLGTLPEEGEGVDPSDEKAIKQHLTELIMGKRNGSNGNGAKK